MEPVELARILTARHPGYQADALLAIGAALVAHIDEARTRWPTLPRHDAELAQHLAGLLPDGAEPLGWLEGTRVAEIALAWAATASDAAARIFEREYGRALAAAIARVTSGDEADDVAQRVRERLFLGGPDGVPKLHRYAGRGSLESWLRVLATRAALESRARPSEDDELERLASAADLPEQALSRARDRSAFKHAFAAASRALDGPQRLLLSQYYLDGVNLEELGRLHRSHASTISRRLARARGELLRGVRRILRDEHDLAPDDIEDLVLQVQSQVDLSLSRLLRG